MAKAKRVSVGGSRHIDLTGRRFGRLVCLRRAEGDVGGNGRGARWVCGCDCGEEKVAAYKHLVGGSTTSCGCFQREDTSRRKLIDLTGRRFGKWLVVSRGPTRETGSGGVIVTWLCRCDCGREKPVIARSLTDGGSTSCGCTRRRDGGMGLHGYSKLPGYTLWHTMKQRCSNPRNSAYEKYGAKGITVCARWLHFPLFSDDMLPRPSDRHSLDRIDRAGGYWCGRHDLCEECRTRGNARNVRWATAKEQTRNKGNNVLITHAGETLALCVWAERTGLSPHVIKTRLSAGWPVEKALTTPARHKSVTRSPALIDAATAIRAVRDRLAATLGLERADTVIRTAARLATSTEPIIPPLTV